MISVEPLRRDQYRQVAEWKFGPQSDDEDWERYTRDMEAPKWSRYGLHLDGRFAGCVSLERTGSTTAEWHIVTARHAFHPNYLALVLVVLAGRLFDQGFLGLSARAPVDRPAASRLALRCGMHEYGHTDTERFFMMTKQRYQELWVDKTLSP